jgi:hypothetical protein
MKFWLGICLFILVETSWALEIPKDFEESKGVGSTSKLYVQPKTFETVSISNDPLDDFEITASKDAYAEIKETVEAKSRTLSWILNIKNWKITDSTSAAKNGSQLILFFGSYVDSSDDLTMFTEAYWLPRDGKPESYLFTRTKQPYTAKEIADRFKVALP